MPTTELTNAADLVAVARARILRALTEGPRTASELSTGTLQHFQPRVPASVRDDVLAALVWEGLVTARLEAYGFKRKPTPTYRLAPLPIPTGGPKP